MSPVKAVAQYPTIMAGAVAAADRVFEVLDLPSDEGDRPGEIPAAFRERIEYRRGGFSSHGTPAAGLRDGEPGGRRGRGGGGAGAARAGGKEPRGPAPAPFCAPAS